MKKIAVKILVLAIAVLLLPIGLLAHDYPHTDTYCGFCHKPHKSLGTAANYSNLCISCHKPGMLDRARVEKALTSAPPTTPEYKYVRPFSYGDQANPFNNDEGLNKSPNKIQNSHKWVGSDNVPEAGAVPPTSKELNPVYPFIPRTNPNTPAGTESPMLIGRLECYRCHSLSVRKESATNSAPFLRGLITQDQMCYDCHKPRVTTTHLNGTHPVSINYSSVAMSKPGQYYLSPVNSNPTNPTSKLKMKNGNVVCTTCHGVHYTDSNSFTYDKYSSATMVQFSTSKGYLLKTDYKRGSHTERNICTNCHRSNDFPEENPQAQVKNHNGNKNQNIQCVDCHGGHVEFAGYSTAAGGIPMAEKTPNIYLINRYMNISSPQGAYKTIRNAKVIFNDSNNKNYNKNSNGVCIACHANGLPSSVSQHSSTDASVCTTCHTHRQGFSAGCTTCHGYPPENGSNPPIAGEGGGPLGYANTPYDYSTSGVYKAENATPHITHAGYYPYTCDDCHKGFRHVNGNFQDVFLNHTGLIAGPIAAYNKAGVGTCSNVYCHSDGKGNYKPVPWENGKGTIVGTPGECSACHKASPDTATHPRHVAGGEVGKSYSCATCHAATVNGAGAVFDKSKHVDGTKDVAYSGDVTACSSCHNDGKGGLSVLTVEKRKIPGNENWDYSPADFATAANGACGTCHNNPMINDAHPAHLTAINGPLLVAPACNECHTYTGELGTTHVDGTVQAIETCAPCHPVGSGTTKANWTNPSSVTCESCHSKAVKSEIFAITAPSKSEVLGHMDPNGANYECTTCHAKTAPHLNRDPAVHAFRLLTTLSSGEKPNKACSYCHNDSAKVPVKFLNMSTHFTAKGQPPNMACWQCHELHGTSNNSMVKTRIVYGNSSSNITFLNRSTGMIDRNNYRGLCQVCHTQTKYYRAGVPETAHPESNCFACHPHNTKGGAFAPFGSCDACHGYPPVPKSAIVGPAYPSGSPLYKQTFGVHGNYTSAKFEDYSGGGGVHLWHVANNKKATDGWGPCAVCHTGGNTGSPASHVARMPLKNNISNVTVDIDQRFRFADAGFPTYSGAKLVNPPAVNQTGSCVNVACHFQPTPRWSLDR